MIIDPKDEKWEKVLDEQLEAMSSRNNSSTTIIVDRFFSDVIREAIMRKVKNENLVGQVVKYKGYTVLVSKERDFGICFITKEEEECLESLLRKKSRIMKENLLFKNSNSFYCEECGGKAYKRDQFCRWCGREFIL